MRRIILLSVLATSLLQVPAFSQEKSVYDLITVDHHSLSMNISDFEGKTIYGKDKLNVISKQKRLKTIPLSLLHMSVDSVWVGDKLVSSDAIQYNDTILTISLRRALKRGRSKEVTVAYHGVPVERPFGGFSWFPSQRMAHNMGVSINDIPHSFAKSWYPAVDDFRARATYDFTYTVPADLVAVGNGLLTQEKTLSDGTKQWSWSISQPVPDYLVNVAVGDYKTIHYELGGLPIDIYVTPDEYESALETFDIIPAAVASLQLHFGPCAFDRVGFVTVNSPSGAMEHATNISLMRNPRPTPSYQETAIHELIHQWFGDDVTCLTPGDMWLNEGITSYMVEVVLEDFVKWGLAKPEQLANYQRSIDRSASFIQKGNPRYHALAGTPETDTYGNQVYRRGAYVTRQLRQLLGDDLFFKGMKQYVKEFHLDNASTEDFKESLEKTTGVALTAFFDEYIYN